MAHLIYSRSVISDLGGHHQQDRRLVHDTAAPRYSDQRPVARDTAPGSNHATEGRGDGQSTAEDTLNDDDDGDSSTAQDGEDDEDEPEAPAPFHGLGKGKGKGKRPAIRIEPAGEESQDDDNETASNGTGLIHSKHPVSQLLKNNKKRTFSNLSSTSVLFGDDSTDQEFPRRKMARKLSNVVTKPLLTYKEEDNDLHENAIESDDEDYSAINLIPDDDDDIDILEQQEENFILQEDQQATALLNEFRDARRLSLESCVSDNIFDVTAPLDESFMSGLPDFGFSQFFEPEAEALPTSPDPVAKRKYSDSSTKRVRFDDEVQVSDSSSSESSELDSSVFPDLFLEQDKLPPILHQLLEFDHDEDNGDFASPQSDASFWDFGQDEPRITQVDDSDDTDNDSAGSSGYDSDMGDTTDEEDLTDAPPRTPMQNRSVLRQPASAPGSRAATPKPFQRSSRPVGRQGPVQGLFYHREGTKAIAITNKATKALEFFRPRPTPLIPWIPMTGYHSSTSSTANNSPRNSIAQPNASDSEVSNEVFNNALGTDIMLSGIFGSAPDNDFMFGTESIGPPEAFYPFVSIGPNGSMNHMEEDEYDDSDDYEDDLNIADFMDFGSEGDDTDVEQEDDETDVPATPSTSQEALNGSTPAQPTPVTETPVARKRSTSDAMLQHFDRGVVTAFRNNQNRYRDVASLPQDPAARASVSRPVRSGKSAEALITPLRKRSRSNRMTRTPLQASSGMANHSSPLSGVTKATSRLQNSLLGTPRAPPPRMGTFS